MSDGSVYRDFYNETLDNGTVVLVHIQQLNIEPFDTIEISFDAGLTYKKFYILDITESIASFEPLLYNYTITYVSRTIHLQKIILPNVSNTKRKFANVKSAYEKINELNTIYGLKKRVLSSHLNVYGISTGLTNLTLNVDCIEFNLQNPTLFQVFNVILSPLNCIITINQNDELDYIDLTQKNTSLNVLSFNEVLTIKNGAEYVSDLSSDMINAMTNKETITEWISVRRPGQALLPRDKDLQFYTTFPIYKVIKVELEMVTGTTANDGSTPLDGDEDIALYRIDITDLIVEKQIWDLLEPSDSISIQFNPNKKQCFFWYQVGNNVIGSMFDNQEFWTQMTFNYILQSKHNPNNQTPIWENFFFDSGAVDTNAGIDIREVKIRVTYNPLTSTKILTSRYLPQKHNVVMPNAQSENLIETEKFGIFNEQTANRVGNPEITVINRYDNIVNVPVLGDYINDYILAGREISVHEGFINFKGSFYENYVQKTLFTGVNAKRRMWAIARTEEAIERSELIKINAEFSFSNKNEVGWLPFSNSTNRNNYVQYLLSGMAYNVLNTNPNSTSKRVVGMASKTVVEIDEVLGEVFSEEFFLETAIFQAGRSVLITSKMFDNYAVDIQVSNLTNFGPLQKYFSYVDNNGEAISFNFKLLKRIRNEISDYTIPAPYDTVTRTLYDQVNNNQTYTVSVRRYTNTEADYKQYVQNTTWKLPKVYTGQYQNEDVIFEHQVPIYKDNRETLRFTIQNEFTSDNKNIVVTEKMAEYCALLTGIEHTNVRFYYSTTEQYSLDDKTAKGTMLNLSPFNVVNNVLSLSISALNAIAPPIYSDVQSWAIADLDGNLIIGVNKVEATPISSSIYLNILKYRQGI
jgi:hypothetical protein